MPPPLDQNYYNQHIQQNYYHPPPSENLHYNNEPQTGFYPIAGVPPPVDLYIQDYNYDFQNRPYINNSNLVDVTQQQRDKSKCSNKIAVQVGNVLEIVTTNKLPDEVPQPVAPPKPAASVYRTLTVDEIRQKNEKRLEAKRRRKVERDKKRMEKRMRKEKLKLEVQRYIGLGLTADGSDDEELVLENVHVSFLYNFLLFENYYYFVGITIGAIALAFLASDISLSILASVSISLARAFNLPSGVLLHLFEMFNYLLCQKTKLQDFTKN